MFQGKTFLSASIIEHIADKSDPMVFAFLDYQARESISTLQLLHSFIWQMILDHEKLQPPLILAHKQEYRRLVSDLGYVKDLFGRFLDSVPIMFIVIDGLDEILQEERRQILRIVLEVLQVKTNVKVLISSRPKNDISNIISKESQPLRVHDCNNHDIEAYVNSRAASLVSDDSVSESGLVQEISKWMKGIGAKAEGNYTYMDSIPHPRVVRPCSFHYTAPVRLGLIKPALFLIFSIPSLSHNAMNCLDVKHRY